MTSAWSFSSLERGSRARSLWFNVVRSLLATLPPRLPARGYTMGSGRLCLKVLHVVVVLLGVSSDLDCSRPLGRHRVRHDVRSDLTDEQRASPEAQFNVPADCWAASQIGE